MSHPRSTVLAAVLLFATLAAPQAADAGPFKVGAGIFVPVGANGTVDSVTTNDLDGSEQPLEEEFDGNSGIGFTLFGTFSAIPYLDTGIALHILPGLSLTDDDKNAYDLGSGIDLNLRLGSTIPISDTDFALAIHGEGGLSFFSLGEDEAPEECVSGGGTRSRLCQIYQLDGFEDKTDAVGFNAGGGVAVRYGVVPFFGLRLGLDFQFYSIPLFNGDNAGNLSTFKADLTGTRFRLNLGVDFDL